MNVDRGQKGEDRQVGQVCEKKRDSEKLLERSFLDRLIPARRLALSQSGKNVKRENVIVKNEGGQLTGPWSVWNIYRTLYLRSPY